jgi:acyl-CoA dehydrogenase
MTAVRPDLDDVRAGVRAVCAPFGEQYWQSSDQHASYPEEFVAALTEGGWLSVHVPERYGGGGRGIAEASVVMEELNRSGANGAACHAQMYALWVLLRTGTEEQRSKWLPRIAEGALRLQAFGVTEPDAGSDTPTITTRAVRDGDHYTINGQKVFTSRVQHSDLLLLLARTTPLDAVDRRVDGMTLFLVDLREVGTSVRAEPIRTMVNHETNALFIDELRVPLDARLGEEGRGFQHLLDALNAERILIASECIGDGRWFIDRAVAYANERVVFGRPIGSNQGVQFPLADAHMRVEAADAIRWRAVDAFDAGAPAGPLANMAKYLASEASIAAGDAAMTTFGGWGMTVEYGIERKFRETRLYRVAPITNNLVLGFVGQHVLGLPKSY